jgi:2-polyprenyl-6-hydroxyphenyl methylase/3-demethylubiquinone-9 3-methyltransferase
MALPQHVHSQDEIFAEYDWYSKNNLLNRLTADRCDYIESRVERVFGRGALGQQEILEVGCGGGLLCYELVRRGAIVVGVDPSSGALAGAERYLRSKHVGQQGAFNQGYAEALPYADGSFSVIICLDVLEHVRDLRQTLHEIARVLAPGGLFIFDTINRTFMARLALILIGERFFQKQGLVPGLHTYDGFIKPRELQKWLTHNELQVQEMTGFMPRIVEGRLTLAPGWFKGVSYIGYATKGRTQ